MRALLSLKQANEIVIALIAVAGLAVISSSVLLVSSVKSVAAAYSASDAVPVKLPSLAKSVAPYTHEDYKAVQRRLESTEIVKVEATTSRLIVSAANIKDELRWRHVVSDAMALDRNLRTVRVCGNVANACSGAALVAEFVGERQAISIKE